MVHPSDSNGPRRRQITEVITRVEMVERASQALLSSMSILMECRSILVKKDGQLGSYLRILMSAFSTNAAEVEHASPKHGERISSERSLLLDSPGELSLGGLGHASAKS